MFSDEKVIENLCSLGLTKYEARVYLALLRNNLSYGSEIQRISGVPGPKVYETLSALIEKGLVYPAGSNPVRYQPLPLEDFLKIREKEFHRVTGFLNEHSKQISEKRESDWLWQLKGYDNLLDKAKELIAGAQKTITVSFWDEEGRQLADDLAAAQERGVHVVSIQMGTVAVEVGRVFRHFMIPVVYEVHGKELVLVVDKTHGMFMVRSQGNGVEGYYSSNRGLVQLIENYVRHDIFINRAIHDFKDEMLARYGSELEELLKL